MSQLHWDDVPPENLARARVLRRNATFAERKLWCRLRSYGLGVKFRRQQPIGPYIVDFFSTDCGLVVEVDGDTHGYDDARTYDKTRTDYLESLGYRVLRYTNHEVMRNLDAVLSDLAGAINERAGQ